MEETLSQFEKNASELVRVSLVEYKGRKLIDMRIFYNDDEGQYRPTKKGLSLALDIYPDFKRALGYLEAVLIERGLIESKELL